MANWLTRIDIVDLLTEDDSDENAVCVAAEVKRRLEEAIPAGHPLRDEELEGILCTLRDVPEVTELNYALDRLYDWGDLGHRLFINTIPGLLRG